MNGPGGRENDAMTSRPRRLVAALVACVLFSIAGFAVPVAAQDDDASAVDDVSGRTVVVATKALDPFVIVDSTDTDGSGLRGYSIDVWNELADRLGVTTEWVVQESVGDILESARTGDADVAIAGISMTAERETFIDFAHPYFDSGLQVVTRPSGDKGTWESLWDVITSGTVLALAGGLVVLIALVAHLVWWTERRHNPEFPQEYRKGISEALWWSSVSIVTGGEAVKDIRRPLSRVLALMWMVIGLFLIAFVTAQAASSLTVNELQGDIGGLEDLPGTSVVTVAGTVGETFLREANIAATGVSDVDTALQAVEDGRFDAVVYDAPVLAYRVNTDYSGRLELAGSTFAPDPYGIALTTGSDLREPINASLLEISRDGTLDALNQKWLGTDR